jgi:predicted MFS family arabinose efflux permease
MSAGLEVTEAQVGFLVSLWAGALVVASFPLVRLTARWNRRSVIIAALLLLTVSSVLSASAPDHGWMIVARLLGALAVGLLWATINAFVADIVPDARLATGVAVVLGGATLGTVFGTAGASFIGVATDWRVPFWVLAGLSLAGAALVRLVIVAPARTTARAAGSAGDAGSAAGEASRRRAHRTLVDPMVMVTALVALMLIGHYGAFTFITRLTELSASILAGGTATVLLVFGVASAAGIAVAGKSGTRTPSWLLVSSIGTALAVLALLLADVHPLAGVVVVFMWGALSGAMPALAQTMILRLAGPDRRTFAGTLIPVLFNVGVAAGAGLASSVVVGVGITALPVISGIVIGAAVVGQIALAGRMRSRSGGVQR